jgi:hypothetical protein
VYRWGVLLLLLLLACFLVACLLSAIHRTVNVSVVQCFKLVYRWGGFCCCPG